MTPVTVTVGAVFAGGATLTRKRAVSATKVPGALSATTVTVMSADRVEGPEPSAATCSVTDGWLGLEHWRTVKSLPLMVVRFGPLVRVVVGVTVATPVSPEATRKVTLSFSLLPFRLQPLAPSPLAAFTYSPTDPVPPWSSASTSKVASTLASRSFAS